MRSGKKRKKSFESKAVWANVFFDLALRQNGVLKDAAYRLDKKNVNIISQKEISKIAFLSLNNLFLFALLKSRK